jgi:hypothetical protein
MPVISETNIWDSTVEASSSELFLSAARYCLSRQASKGALSPSPRSF